MARTLPPFRSRGSVAEWRERIGESLPNETEFVTTPPNTWFQIIDMGKVRFLFDPDPQAQSHDVEVSEHPDFAELTQSFTVPQGGRSVTTVLNDQEEEICTQKFFFRVRSTRNGVKTEWSPPAVFSSPVPGALALLEAFHTVNNTSEERPIINVNIHLPRTADIGGRTISDRRAQWTAYVELEADWTALAGAITAAATQMTVTANQGPYLKKGGFYKLDDEIVEVTNVTGDVADITRAHFGGAAADHADATVVKFYSRILRNQFTAADMGIYAVTVTIPNDEKVRVRNFVARAYNRCGQAGPDSNFALDLPPPALIVDLVAEPLFQHVILRWSEQVWTAYRYEIYHSTTGQIPIADLDPTQTPGVTLMARPLADHAGEATYRHDIKFEGGTFHYYGVRSVDILGGYNLPTGGDTVGPVQPDSSTEQPAADVTNISASEGPATILEGRQPRSRGISQSSVTCGFDPPSPIGSFGACAIFILPTASQGTLANAINASQTTMEVDRNTAPLLSGWRFFRIDSEAVEVTGTDLSVDPAVLTIVRGVLGTTAASHSAGANLIPFEKPKEVTRGPEAPLVFTWPPIGQVTLYFVSVAASGIMNDVFSSPSLSINLDGMVSPPLEVQNLRGIKTVNGGIIVWSDGLEPDLRHYEIADLGSRTLVNQADVTANQIVGQILATPGDDRRVIYNWLETEYEGTIAQGSSTIVLPSAQLFANRFAPIGTPPVNETLRFTFSDAIDDLTETDYAIASNTDSTIVLTAPPAEAANGSVSVRFYVGTRTHKFYVNAANNSDLKSEWRPVEGTFLELAPNAPDGSVDIGVPKIQPSPLTSGAFYNCGASAAPVTYPARGVIEVRPAALGDIQKRNITGISSWVVRVTYTDLLSGATDQTFECDHAIGAGEGTFFELPASAGFVFNSQRFTFSLPNVEVTQVDLAAKNYFGRGPFAQIPFEAGVAGPYFTGNRSEKPHDSVTSNSPITLDLTKTSIFEVEMASNVTNITMNGAKKGREFTIFFNQDATGGRTVTWPAAFKGVTANSQPKPTASKYTAFSFYCRSDTEYRLQNTPVREPD